jgi:cytochrome c biogenesis protein CcmG/thiol:disulfide interchange protein DsbE
MMRAAQVAAVALVLALLGVLVYDLARDDGSEIPRSVERGELVQAPEWARERLDSEGTLSLAMLRGSVVVLNFWQSYCPPCVDEAPTLVAASERWQAKNVVFVGIDVQDLRGPALKFLERFDIKYPNVKDNGSLVGRYGVTGFPETFFIDKRGRVVSHIIGEANRADLDRGIRLALRS